MTKMIQRTLMAVKAATTAAAVSNAQHVKTVYKYLIKTLWFQSKLNLSVKVIVE